MTFPSDSSATSLEADFEIVNSRGLHARASAKFVKCTEQFDAQVKVSREGVSVCGLSIMGLMMLGAGIGTTIHVEVTGPEAPKALEALGTLITSGFGEED